MKLDPNTFSEEDKEIYEWLEESIKKQFSKYYNIFKKCDIKIVDNIFINFLSGLSEDEINKYSNEINWISNKWLKNLINEINFKILNLLKNKWTIPYIDEKIVYELLEYPRTKQKFRVLSDKYSTLESKKDFLDFILHNTEHEKKQFLKIKWVWEDWLNKIIDKVFNIISNYKSDSKNLLLMDNNEIKVIKRLSQLYNLHYEDIKDALEDEWIELEDLEEIIWWSKNNKTFKWWIKKHFPDLHRYLKSISD